MKHEVGRRSTIERDRETQEWVATINYHEGSYSYRSLDLLSVVLNLSEMGELEPDSYETRSLDGIEEVLVVVPGLQEGL